MTYSTTNAPYLVAQPITGKRKWRYDAVEATSLVAGSSYISNGIALGLKAGDTVEHYNSSGNWVRQHVVATENTDSVNLSAGVTVAGTT